MTTSIELPRYRSHKEVWALKIAAIEIHQDSSAKIAPVDPRYGTVHAGFEYGLRFKGDDNDLGYYVRYADGYESWSPTKAFEEGYTLIK